MSKLVLACTLFIGFSLLLFSCQQSNEKEEKYLPIATGKPGEIVVVTDSAQWKGPVGDAIREVFADPILGLINDEPRFKLLNVRASKLNDLIKRHQNILVVTAMDTDTRDTRYLKTFYTKESVKKIMADSAGYEFIQNDLFSKGQIVYHLFSKDTQTLCNQMKAHAKELRNFFHEDHRNRLQSSIFTQRNTGYEKAIKNHHGIEIKIPYGFDIAKDTVLQKDSSGFFFIRSLTEDEDVNAYVWYEPYVSETQLQKEYLISRNDEWTKQFIYDVDKPEMFVMTEPLIPIKINTCKFNSHFAQEIRGSWRTSLKNMGGPFISYAFVDENHGRIFFVSGFIFAPSRSKMPLIRTVDAIIHTLTIPQ